MAVCRSGGGTGYAKSIIVADLPARAQAHQAKQTQAEKSKGKGARGKQGQPPTPAQATIPAAANGQDRPRAASRNQHGSENAVQLSMFDVFAANPEVTASDYVQHIT